MRKRLLAAAGLLLLAAGVRAAAPSGVGGVGDALLAVVPEGEWLSYGRDHAEQRFSPLAEINDGNVARLGLAWYADIETTRGQEATPLMHDGVLYVSTAWSLVKAYDARTGALKWSYDPKVPRDTLGHTCCDAVNRGVALYGHNLYVAALDGRLIALDARTGREVWSKLVVPNQVDYTITGAPRVARGKVFIGSAGAEYKARGFLAAFDAATGRELWRFHTVPGDPARGFENAAMARAARTWSGEWWKLGGGGTVWDSITYDPATNLVLFGTGNAEPWNPAAAGRSGENLYTSSVVAVNADTGRYAWHFQETPEDRWDYDSVAQIMLADLTIGGKRRHVALHAPKNGYFYALDARTGAFISAGSLVPQTWTTGIDQRTGRPTINPAARYELTGKVVLTSPSPGGAHNWPPMSYSPRTGLVYLPVNVDAFPYRVEKDWTPSAMGYQTATDFSVLDPPPGPAKNGRTVSGKSLLVAWDPVKQREAWRSELPLGLNGGTLATAGNLVFQGGMHGQFVAYSADEGAKLWSFATQTGVAAAPMTYSLGGRQYVAVLAGWGGRTSQRSRLLVFALGATGKLPPAPPADVPQLDPPAFTGTVAQVTRGSAVYGRYCLTCHTGGYDTPVLRTSAMIHDGEAMKAIVLGGALSHKGMVSFSKALNADDVEAIRQYLIKRANEAKAAGGG
jgi:alcohol dehydrogenase (cytochrome c)/quinohemoprotein ethanol dehydrogenase